MSGEERRRMRLLGAIWLGQLVSVVGSSLTTFVLGVMVYQRTGSVTQFAVLTMAAVLPGIVASPLAGALADRADRRWLLMTSDAGAGLATGALALLLALDELAVWHVYAATAVAATCNTVHLVAYSALVPALVPRRHLGRVNGLLQATQAARIAAPLVAGLLVGTIGVVGVLAIDLGTFAFAMGVLLAVPLPEAARRAGGARAGSLLADLGAGWRYLRERAGLLRLVAVFGCYNFVFALASVLVQPLILSFASPATLGALVFAGGSGFFAGSLVMGAWGGPRRRVRGIVTFIALGGVALLLHGARPSPWLIAAVAPAFLFTLPVINGCAMTLLQTKVEAAVLGRALATVRMVAQSAMPAAYLVAGPLADRVFEPWLRPGGLLAGSAGRLIGVGEGRGIAALFALLGLALLVLALAAHLQPRLRHAEEELPDALAAPAPTAAPA